MFGSWSGQMNVKQKSGKEVDNGMRETFITIPIAIVLLKSKYNLYTAHFQVTLKQTGFYFLQIWCTLAKAEARDHIELQ